MSKSRKLVTMSSGGATVAPALFDKDGDEDPLLVLGELLLLAKLLTLNKSLAMSISIDLALMARRYLGRIFFRLASIRTIRVVFKQLTFSWERLFMFIMFIMRHKKTTRLSNELK